MLLLVLEDQQELQKEDNSFKTGGSFSSGFFVEKQYLLQKYLAIAIDLIESGFYTYRIVMATITQTYEIRAPLFAVWEALVDPKIINSWGGGPAAMSDEEGKEFSLWGGDVHGKNIKVIKGRELQQEWLSGTWKKPSLVTFLLDEADGITTVTLYQKDIPDEDAKDIEDGWNSYYLGPLKQLLERSSV